VGWKLRKTHVLLGFPVKRDYSISTLRQRIFDVKTKRIEISGGPEWAEIETMRSGLCVVARSEPEMFVAAPSMEEMERILPFVVADLRAAIRKGEA
jgi:hypothetical protein